MSNFQRTHESETRKKSPDRKRVCEDCKDTKHISASDDEHAEKKLVSSENSVAMRSPRPSSRNHQSPTLSSSSTCCPEGRLDLFMHCVNSPHPGKAAKGGEDAFFVHRNAFGIFDGVGGWAEKGVDASLYSKELSRLVVEFIERHGRKYIVTALRHAARNNQETGSSTACVTALCRSNIIGVNVGDSGFIVIRDGSVIFETEPQQRGFNYPYQLGTGSTDRVMDGQFFCVKVQCGDLIVAGSDGLWDNVLRSKIVGDAVQALGRKDMETLEGLRCFARNLTEDTKRMARRTFGMSPFGMSALKAGMSYCGGKMDDITIIVGLVLECCVARRDGKCVETI